MELLPLMGLNLAVAILVMILVWAVSVKLRDASIVDIAWGGNGALLALLTFILTDGPLPRRLLITTIAASWGIRLALYIGRRQAARSEDFRYAAWRKEQGAKAFPLWSLHRIFLLQGVLNWAIAAPVQVAQTLPGPANLTLLDWAGLMVWGLGYLIEVAADRQLKDFLSDPENRGKVMDRGLWRYSRHPNYFGESLIWWGIFLVAAAVPWGWVTLFSPLLMTYFLLEVSGVPMLEEALAQRREGYRAYMERTSAFIPWPPHAPSEP